MILSQTTLQQLRDLINEKTEYRSGPQLVELFNSLGFNDKYGRNFPSRWMYTDAKLAAINGTPAIENCIKMIFTPARFVGRYTALDDFIKEFNQYIVYDGWNVVRKNNQILFSKATLDIDKEIEKEKNQEAVFLSEDDFLKKDFAEIVFPQDFFDQNLILILEARIAEIKSLLQHEIPLATIFLLGSTLEGILLAVATRYPKEFNTAPTAPKGKDGKVKAFHEWTLNDYINVSYSLGILREDVKKFSHAVRDFRNYIHPYEQMMRNFSPDINSAKICFHVHKAAIAQINSYCKNTPS